MKMILKGCPRCGGDLIPDRWDQDGQDVSCVQCGYEGPLARVLQARPSLVSALQQPGLALERRVA